MTIDTETTCLSDHTRKQLASNKKKQGENSSTQRVASESNDSEVHPTSNKSPQQISPKDRIKKRTKSGGCPWPRKLRSRTLNGHKDSVASPQQIYPSTRGTQKKDAPQMENTALAEDHNDSTEGKNTEHSATYGHDSLQKEESADGNICRQEDNGRSWKVIEKGLLVKGLEIFGRNRLDDSSMIYISVFDTLNLMLMCCFLLYNQSGDIFCVALHNLSTCY
jgi:histone-lysine N-methyltransferase EZH2